ncbi:MAG: hypothetical protein K6G90_01665 [Clostridia bacterium]|nr:hypothetical protein [Clostridia bacterium]
MDENSKNTKAQLPEIPDAMCDTWAATDGLGRALPSYEEVGGPRNRFVGMFYWTWHIGQRHLEQQPVNVNDIIERFPEASHDVDHPAWGPQGVSNHWNEPLYGYYLTDDRWVLRRHAELLAAAGVDVIIFDNTNGTATWKDSYDVLFEVFAQARRDGVNTPRISFLLPFWACGTDRATHLRKLYNDVYKPGRYKDLWFFWKGKPLVMCSPEDLWDSSDPTDREILSFFTFRPGIPEYNVSDAQRQAEDRENGRPFRSQYWSWLSVYPQAINRNEDGTPEQMAVSVAQNWSAERGLTAMNGENVFGRTYASGGYDKRPDALLRGANFAEQARRALAVDPEFVFITGFNEWVAGRYKDWYGVTNAFPDEFNDEFSRDVEPSKGKLKDHYYYQTVDFIRRYKGVRPAPRDSEYRRIATFDDWRDVPCVYRSYPGNTFDRDAAGYGGIRYTDLSGRNDIVLAKTASDEENVCFYVECADELSPCADRDWMRLLISIPGAGCTKEGYTHAVNTSPPSDGITDVVRFDGEKGWSKAGSARIDIDGNRLMLAVPKTALGIDGDSFAVDFKWTDNIHADFGAADFYLYGDTAPTGRFNYRYRFCKTDF